MENCFSFILSRLKEESSDMILREIKAWSFSSFYESSDIRIALDPDSFQAAFFLTLDGLQERSLELDATSTDPIIGNSHWLSGKKWISYPSLIPKES